MLVEKSLDFPQVQQGQEVKKVPLLIGILKLLSQSIFKNFESLNFVRGLRDSVWRSFHVTWLKIGVSSKLHSWLSRYQSNFVNSDVFYNDESPWKALSAEQHKKLKSQVASIHHIKTWAFKNWNTFRLDERSKEQKWEFQLKAVPQHFNMPGVCYGASIVTIKHLLNNPGSRIANFTKEFANQVKEQVIYYQALGMEITTRFNFEMMNAFQHLMRPKIQGEELLFKKFKDVFLISQQAELGLLGLGRAKVDDLPGSNSLNNLSLDKVQAFLLEPTPYTQNSICYKIKVDEHTFVVHMDNDRGVFELFNHGVGCLSFPNKETLVKATVELLAEFYVSVTGVSRYYK